jgi:hypothetical protein
MFQSERAAPISATGDWVVVSDASRRALAQHLAAFGRWTWPLVVPQFADSKFWLGRLGTDHRPSPENSRFRAVPAEAQRIEVNVDGR